MLAGAGSGDRTAVVNATVDLAKTTKALNVTMVFQPAAAAARRGLSRRAGHRPHNEVSLVGRTAGRK